METERINTMAGERTHNNRPIIAELRRLHSPDVQDLQSGPDTPDNFCILIQAMIGPIGASGEESFDFTLCTPKWLAEHLSEGEFLFGRYYLIVHHYDYGLINRTIASLCQRASGSSWHDVAERLATYGRWEFEDYVDRA
jgi:hypothetical protein